MNTPSEIIDALGRDKIAEELGVTPKRVGKARHGLLPAWWLNALEQMAGHPLPRDCFAFQRETSGREAAE